MFGRMKLVSALIAEKAVNTELRAEVARLTTHFDWLASHVNELKIERAALLERCIGIQLAAVPIIQREPTATLPGADPNYPLPPAGKLPNIGDILAKARDIVEDGRKPGADRQSLVSAEMAGISFEDMGDDAAALAGIQHAPDGSVVHTR